MTDVLRVTRCKRDGKTSLSFESPCQLPEKNPFPNHSLAHSLKIKKLRATQNNSTNGTVVRDSQMQITSQDPTGRDPCKPDQRKQRTLKCHTPKHCAHDQIPTLLLMDSQQITQSYFSACNRCAISCASSGMHTRKNDLFPRVK